MYTSTVEDDRIRRLYHGIRLEDNEEFLLTLNNPKTYSSSVGGEDKFKVWSETYNYDYLTNGILEADIQPFNINKPRFTVSDLNELTQDEVRKKYNQFASILRKFNVGGREGAFDILINLFLSKIVDEERNSDNLKFNWKGVAQDTYFSLVDRLEKLYQLGMENYLNENVTYVSEDEVKNAFRLHPHPDAAKDAVLDYFKQVKYFSNNNFSFIEVYNERLFYQNAQILTEVIKMLQSLKLKAENQNQFLGDLFEGFLDAGVKQSEGQFFTPLPIVKFIVSSLPLDKINNQEDIPKIIDYAAGAGHFLNEYAEQIKGIIDNDKIEEYHTNIYGIEKEYRLSKVSKVSAFMYGQDNINIIYGDALKPQSDITEESFSLVISNPPYSVKGFLSTLDDVDVHKYEISDTVNDYNTTSIIELFFIERTVQLLKPNGIAAIILPTSILSNNSKSYVYARKMIIRKFNIIAITELPSQTFGSTGTNTVILFLEKKNYPPEEEDYYSYAINRWFDNEEVRDEDIQFIKNYTDHISIEYDHYTELQNNKLDELEDYELIQDYIDEIKDTPEFRKLSARNTTDEYTEADKNSDITNLLINEIQKIEIEKAIYFTIMNSQSNDVVIVRSPSKKAKIDRFLGYKWSSRKGQEGIRYLGSDIPTGDMDIAKNRALDTIDTPLFNPMRKDDTEKINKVILDNFNEVLDYDVPSNLEEHVRIAKLSNMVDFNKNNFLAEISLTPITRIKIDSDFPIDKLGNVVEVKIGGTPSRTNNSYFNNGTNLWVSISEMDGNIITNTDEKITDEGVDNSNVKLIPEGTTLLSFKLSIGKTAIAGADLYTNEAIAGLIPKSDKVLDKYIYFLFTSKIIDLENISSKAFGKSLNSTYLKNEVKIPVPPVEVQNELIERAEALVEEYQTIRMTDEDFILNLQEIIHDLKIVNSVEED